MQKTRGKGSNHAGNLLDCIRNREDAICTVDIAMQADTLCHISDIAIRLKQKL